MNWSRSVITRTTHNVMKKLLIIPIVFSSLYVIMFPIKTYKHDYYIFDGGHAIDAAASSATATNKRWAVMMIGGARTYACTRQSFLWNVVNQTNPPMDIIVSTVQNSCSVDKLSSEEYQLKQQLGNLVGTFI